jgi:hypothetical protein
MADLQPEARRRYLEWLLMLSKVDDYVMTKLTPGPFELCAFMQMADQFSEKRRIVKDAFEAYAAIAMFFESGLFEFRARKDFQGQEAVQGYQHF